MRRLGQLLEWRAVIEGQDAGGLKLFVRPDARHFASFDSCQPGVEQASLAAMDEQVGCVLYVNVDENDKPALQLYQRLGFVVHRRESVYAVPTDPGATGLETEEVPGISLVTANHVDEQRLRVLDDALRQDVPGTDGWRWDEAAFHDETFDPAYFDPATYLVAVEKPGGDYVGLARVWNNPGAPRLGLIAVVPTYRRRGLARALLGHVFAVLHERGIGEVTAEVDDTNLASAALLTALGARRSGGIIELRRDAPGGPMAKNATARG